MSQTVAHEPGSFCMVGLATSAPGVARAFYSALFGWEAKDGSAGQAGAYVLLSSNRQEVAILYRQTEAGSAALPHWTPYVLVEDANATAARAIELGGVVIREPTDLAAAGRAAAVRDPTGAIISLWEARAHSGAALVNCVGALCWTELSTTDPVRAMDFYARLLDWEYERHRRGYTTIRNLGTRNGGVCEPRAQELGWIPYFGVESVDDARRHAESLGGRTLMTADRSTVGEVAVLVDVLGAVFGLIKASY